MHTSPPDPSPTGDIRRDAWIMRTAPRSWRPWLELIRADRPIGTWLLLIPGLWSVTMASKVAGPGLPDPWLITLFAVGALVMRGAGCIVNDLWDRDIDAGVARTATRPIASGLISVPAALVFLVGLLAIGLVILLQFNTPAIIFGVASLGLVVVYPLMKRVTYWPQAFLGLTFSWGALLGWVAVAGTLDNIALVNYAACVLWTLGYDTIYGHQDRADDIRVGVRSSSIRLGKNTYRFVVAMYFGTVILLAIAGYHAAMNGIYFAALALAAGQMVWQVATLEIDDPDNCLVRFRSNRDVGLIIFIGCLFG